MSTEDMSDLHRLDMCADIRVLRALLIITLPTRPITLFTSVCSYRFMNVNYDIAKTFGL